MKKFSLSVATDTLFLAFTAFFISLVIFNYFTPYPLNIVFSGTVALFSALLGVKFLLARRGKKIFSARENAEYADFVTKVNFMREAEIIALSEKAAKKNGVIAEKKKDRLYIPERGLNVFFKFGFEELKKADVVRFFNAVNREEKTIIVTESFSGEIAAFAERFGEKITLSDGKEFYSRLKEADCLPREECEIPLTAPKKRYSANNLINKKRAKNYLVFGLLFLGMSYFSPIKLYYVICGSIMLLLSIIVRLFGRDDK